MKDEDIVDVLQVFTDNILADVHTCLPGQIDSYDGHTTKKAKVIPTVNFKSSDNIDVEMPVIMDVPVVFPGNSSFSFLFPLKKGDGCLLLFSEAGIGRYMAGIGQKTSADDQSRFSLTDCIAIPGLFPYAKAAGTTQQVIAIDDTGRFVIKNLVEDALTLMIDFLTAVKTITTTGSPTTHVLNAASIAAFDLLIARFNTFLAGGL